MTQTFQVPDTIPLSAVKEFLAGLGIDVADGLVNFTCSADGVYVEFYATDANGRRYFNPGTSDAAMHRISMRLDVTA